MILNEEENDFFKIFADISFGCLGMFVLLLTILLMSYKQEEVLRSTKSISKEKKREYLSKKFQNIIHDTGVKEMYLEHQKKYLDVRYKILEKEIEIEYYSKEINQLKSHLKIKKNANLFEIKQKLSNKVEQLESESKKIETEFNKYVKLQNKIKKINFSIKGDRYKWWIVVEGKGNKRFSLRPKSFLAFQNALRLRGGLTFVYKPTDTYKKIPIFALKYFRN